MSKKVNQIKPNEKFSLLSTNFFNEDFDVLSNEEAQFLKGGVMQQEMEAAKCARAYKIGIRCGCGYSD